VFFSVPKHIKEITPNKYWGEHYTHYSKSKEIEYTKN
jgi:hypothetical protein